MSTSNSAIAENLVGALSGGDSSQASGAIAPDMKSNFSRSGIDADIGAHNIGEIIERARGSGVKVNVLSQFSDGDQFCGRYSCTVSGDDVPGGKPGTSTEMTGIVMGRIENGQVVELYHEQDTVGMMLALGLPVGV